MEIINTFGILDIIFIAILAISIIVGLIRGVVREIFSLAGLAASLYLAFSFSEQLAQNYTGRFIEDDSVSYIVTFVLVIIVTLFASAIIQQLFSRLLYASGLSFFNRFLGAVFGILRGALICSIVVLVLGFIPGTKNANWWQQSSLVPVFSELTRATIQYTPQSVRDYFNTAATSVTKTAQSVTLESAKPITVDDEAAKSTPLRPSTQNSSDETTTRAVLQSLEQTRQIMTPNDNKTPQPAATNSNTEGSKVTIPATTIQLESTN